MQHDMLHVEAPGKLHASGCDGVQGVAGVFDSDELLERSAGGRAAGDLTIPTQTNAGRGLGFGSRGLLERHEQVGSENDRQIAQAHLVDFV